jgi:Yip1 domain
MDFKFLFQSLIKIIITPAKAWDFIIKENRPDKDMRNSFLYPLIFMVTLAAFLGSIIFTNKTLSPVYSVFIGIKYFILFLFVTFSSALVLGEITKPLDLGRNFTISFRLIVFSLTPLFLCQIASLLFESLIFVNVLSLYGLYIFWTGAEKMLNPPDYKKMPMLIAVFVVVTGIFFAGNLVLNSIVDRIYFSFFA